MTAKSYFRGHPIIYKNDKWYYKDTLEPTPQAGGKSRPCKKCGQESWSGSGDCDHCLGILPGVKNACCGHGIRKESYIVFENGLIIQGFFIVRKANENTQKDTNSG